METTKQAFGDWDLIQLANWARAELQDAEERGDVISRIDALRRVKRVLDTLEF